MNIDESRLSPVFINLLQELIAIRYPQESIRTVASELGIAPSTLSRMLGGKVHPNRDTIQNIALKLNVDPKILQAAASGVRLVNKPEESMFSTDFFNYKNIYSPAARFVLHSMIIDGHVLDIPSIRGENKYKFCQDVFSNLFFRSDDALVDNVKNFEKMLLSEIKKVVPAKCNKREVIEENLDSYGSCDEYLQGSEIENYSSGYRKRLSFLSRFIVNYMNDDFEKIKVVGIYLRKCLHAALFSLNQKKYLSCFSEQIFLPMIKFYETALIEINFDIELRRVENNMQDDIKGRLLQYEKNASKWPHVYSKNTN